MPPHSHSRSERLNSSLQSLMDYRDELSKPWVRNVATSQADVSLAQGKKKENRKLDPPETRKNRYERSKANVDVKAKVVSIAIPLQNRDPPELKIEKNTTKEFARKEDSEPRNPKSSKKSSKDRYDGNLQKMTTKHQNDRLYEDFPRREGDFNKKKSDRHGENPILQKTITTRQQNNRLYGESPRSSRRSDFNLSCSTVSRDEHGLYVEEVDWKNTSVDWGDETDAGSSTQEESSYGMNRSSFRTGRITSFR